MSVEFEHYWPLVFFLGIPLIWRATRHTTIGLAPRHLTLSTVVRGSVIILLALALMQPVWHRAGKWMSVIYALDVSSSVDPAFVSNAIDWIASANAQGGPAHSSFIAFAGSAASVGTPEAIRTLEVSTDGADRSINQQATNLEIAVRQSLRSFDPRYLKRLVLITDGNENTGDVLTALGRAQEAGVRIFTLPATVRGEGDSWIETIVLPEEIRQQEPIVATVQVFSRIATEALVELSGNEGTLQAKEVQLQPGLNAVDFEVRLTDEGSRILSAQLQNDLDPVERNDVHTKSISVDAQPRVLYVEGHSESSHYLRDALVGEGVDVVLGIPGELPMRSSGLDEYDLVLLSDVPRNDLQDAQMTAILDYVRDTGGGFIFVGGETSYGEEGYKDSAVEEVLPVLFEVDEKRKDLALVIVMDKSYSMVGLKLELSKEAAKAALDLLEPTHRFSLITFDDTPYVTVPLQLAVEKSLINEYISRVIAGSQTNIFPALEEAFETLVDTNEEVRHVILLSDGKTYSDDYETLVSSMADSGITVSSVAVGEEADRDLLSNIADWGNGRSYFIRDVRRVPQIFVEETQIASQATLVEEPVVTAVRRSVEAFTGIDLASAPALKGYVRTRIKETAEVLLESDSESPILAQWRYGLGKTAVFTSGVKNRWAVDWLTWDGYGKFWAQLIRETMKRDGDGELNFVVDRVGDEVVITLSAISEEGVYQGDFSPNLEVVESGNIGMPLRLDQVGPSTFQARHPIETSSDDPYLFRLSGDGVENRSEAIYYPYRDEYRLYPPNSELLSTISTQTGGLVLPDIEDIFDDYGESASVPTPLWPWLAGLALLGYLFDIAIRRAPWFWRRFA
ncbi:MAG: VWA domain-containing protein [Gemmatimonadota bacterium]|nr:VWA domain-containing protein [Gemmatimonadota bacterium]